MQNENEIIKKDIHNIKDTLRKADEILETLIEHQLSFEKHFQTFIKTNKDKKIAINCSSKIELIPLDKIMFFLADSSYTKIFSENRNLCLTPKPINDFELIFNEYPFFKISRSTIININYIKSFDKKTNEITMINDAKLPVSRRRKSEFISFLLSY